MMVARSKRRVFLVALVALLALSLAGCEASNQTGVDQPEETWGYMEITQEEAMRMMEEDPNAIVVDVRTQEEYEEGHIPGAICIPNESITDQQPNELPDFAQRILVYCRSGNRSSQAAQKLADMGYTNVHDFGGIIDWTGDIVKGDDTALLLSIDGVTLEVVWEDNESVVALRELVGEHSLEIEMSRYGSFEQVGSLSAGLPTNDEQTTTQVGDIVLYQGNQIVVFYGSNSWAYTRLGHIAGKSADELAQLLGEQDVTLTLEMD